MKVLLISSSYVHGGGYLDNFIEPIKDLLGEIKEIVFVPYAAHESQWDVYTNKVRDRFKEPGISVHGIHEASNDNKITSDTKAIFIGGGNTFRLLKQLQQHKLISQIRDAVLNKGVPYIGSSAGSNVACKTICTTNDMPIVFPEKGFDAINLVPIQLNPHYIDPDPSSTHMGETREQRIKEFHENNDTPVIGIREGAYLKISHDYEASGKMYLGGTSGAIIFYKGKPGVNFPDNGDLVI